MQQPTTQQLNNLVSNVQTSVQQELQSEAFLGLDQIPIMFESVDQLIDFVKNAQYLDENLQPLSRRMDQITEANATGILQLNRELWVASRLFTIQKYKTMDGYYQENFKRLILKGERAEEPLGEIPRLGMKLSPEDWTQYEAAFDQLFILE